MSVPRGSLYGVGIVTNAEDSPHLLIDRIKGEMYFGFAETDEHVPANVIPTLKSGLIDRIKGEMYFGFAETDEHVRPT